MPEDIHEPKGVYKRYLPHYDIPGLYQGITFRLGDSLPQQILKELNLSDVSDLNDTQRARMERFINAGYGECLLKDPRVATIVQDSFLHFHEDHYVLAAWVIMPNHVHLMLKVKDGYSLPEIIQSWKGFTARKINKVLERRGQVWANGFYDRYMRDEKHFMAALSYIHDNPVKAGLVERGEDWRFSSIGNYEEIVNRHVG